MEFENIMKLKGRNLIGDELIESKYHDAIVMVRAIEMHQEEIVKDPEIEMEKLYYKSPDVERILKHIYDKYCSTHINDYKKLILIIKEALELCFKNIDYLIAINTLKQRKNLTGYQKWTLGIIEMNHNDLKCFNYDESLINDILFRLKEFGIKCNKW